MSKATHSVSPRTLDVDRLQGLGIPVPKSGSSGRRRASTVQARARAVGSAVAVAMLLAASLWVHGMWSAQ